MKLNGKSVSLKQEQTLSDFLTAKQFDPGKIAVELNGVIVPRTEYANILLTDEDILEIVQFVGGG